MTTTVEYGVRHPDGSIERIFEAEANLAYMTGVELAAVRARVVGGTIVHRTKQLTFTDWVTGEAA